MLAPINIRIFETKNNMKNYLFLGLAGAALFFNSCSSSNDENEGTNTKVLLSKITTVYYDNPANPDTTVATLSYNSQGQLIKTISEGRASVFEYDSAGKPSKTTYFREDGTLDYYSDYIYNGDQLTTIKAIYANPYNNRTITYTYNTNGQVISTSLCQSPTCSDPIVDTYVYNGNNISSEISTGGGSGSSTKIVYSYDDKQNPYTNLNKYLKFTMAGAHLISKNNYLNEKISHKTTGNWIEGQNRTSTIQYNSSGFPVQVISKEANGNLSAQYNYEYITQ